MRALTTLVALCLLVSCGGTFPCGPETCTGCCDSSGMCQPCGADAGRLGDDAGPPADAGSPDAGSPDAGEADAGAADAGPTDAGGAKDAGQPDAGRPDAGFQPCTNGQSC